jgi:hypothetical protein
MKSLSKALLVSSLIALLVASAFVSASPVLAENASIESVDLLAGEADVDQSAISAGFIEAQTGEAAVADVASVPEGKSEAVSSEGLNKDNIESATADEAEDGESLLRSSDMEANVSALQSFIDSVTTGSRAVTGIYVNKDFTLRVGQQPSGNPGFVSGNIGEVTQFGMASDYGSRGFLAHNYLSGASFFDLKVGDTLALVFGDGSSESFLIQEIRRFEALQPNSPTSTFVDLDEGGKLSATTLFHSIYNWNNPVVLQTCIENHGVSTWGRLFIIAVPLLS